MWGCWLVERRVQQLLATVRVRLCLRVCVRTDRWLAALKNACFLCLSVRLRRRAGGSERREVNRNGKVGKRGRKIQGMLKFTETKTKQGPVRKTCPPTSVERDTLSVWSSCSICIVSSICNSIIQSDTMCMHETTCMQGLILSFKEHTRVLVCSSTPWCFLQLMLFSWFLILLLLFAPVSTSRFDLRLFLFETIKKY